MCIADLEVRTPSVQEIRAGNKSFPNVIPKKHLPYKHHSLILNPGIVRLVQCYNPRSLLTALS